MNFHYTKLQDGGFIVEANGVRVVLLPLESPPDVDTIEKLREAAYVAGAAGAIASLELKGEK